MKQEVNPNNTNRALAFERWMKSPMPMVTLVKTFDVTRLCKMSSRKSSQLKFNMLLCWCIGKAASRMDVFYLLPVGDRLYQYDRLAINVIVNNCKGGINLCDVPFSEDLKCFAHDYAAITEAASATCEDSAIDDAMAVGTSAVVGTELDCIVNQYSGIFNNPFLAWGKYRRHLLKTTLNISFQFHHTQMDGAHAAQFLEELQRTIKTLTVD